MVTPLSHVFFRAFFSFFFGLFAFYFLTWAILASTVPDAYSVVRFGGSTILSGIGSIYFIILYQKSDAYLPKTQSILFYSTMAFFSVFMGIVLYFHIESYQAIPDRMRIPTQVLAVLVYFVFFVFSLIRVSESRFLPSLSKSRVSNERVK